MVLADITLDAGGTVSSENDSPTINPSLRMSATVVVLAKGIPTGNTINGVDIRGINNGQIEFRAKCGKTAGLGGADSFVAVLFRYIDANNYYMFKWRDEPGGASDNAVQLYINNAGVLTQITNNQSVGFGADTWHKFRITWWSALGKIFFRMEAGVSGGAYQQIGADLSYDIDTHKSAANKVGFMFGSDVDNTQTNYAAIEELKVYRA